MTSPVACRIEPGAGRAAVPSALPGSSFIGSAGSHGHAQVCRMVLTTFILLLPPFMS